MSAMTATDTLRRTLGRIPDGSNYEGYLWLSDEQVPDDYQVGEVFSDDLESAAIPYVVEGWLYDTQTEKSYAIRYHKGEYIRTEYDLANAAERNRLQSYIAHDLDAPKYWVVEQWAPVEDKTCAGMEVLRHTWTAFAGFTKPTKK
jgi:CRISPR type III-associated protein (TIGR04423 family)